MYLYLYDTAAVLYSSTSVEHPRAKVSSEVRGYAVEKRAAQQRGTAGVTLRGVLHPRHWAAHGLGGGCPAARCPVGEPPVLLVYPGAIPNNRC